MKVSVSWLKNLIREASVRSDEKYVSEEEAKELVLDTDGDTIAGYDVIDEDTGEIYLKAGETFDVSPWSPDHKLNKKRATKDETYARRAGVWDVFFGEEEPEPDDAEDWFEGEQTRIRTLEDAYHAAVKDYASNWLSFARESPDTDPQDAAPDAAEGFFAEYPEWRDWAQALRMKRSDMKGAIADYIHDAMTANV